MNNENDGQTDTIVFGPEDLAVMENSGAQAGPTASNICVNNFPGSFNFCVIFENLATARTSSKSWDVSISVTTFV